ncbi:MAG TPA: TerY-C metal binding domain-containing protein, partial [Gemmataceae bacterium]|nr:TerY-C metal binding domain-containing protein [Gemmataceae bacterium]
VPSSGGQQWRWPLAQRWIDREVTKTAPGSKGDYKPFVILITDGQPTDDWEGAAAAVQSPQNPWRSNLLAVACGPDADPDLLRRVAPTVLLMKDMAPAAWRKVFVWLTASVQTTSQSVGTREGQGVTLPPPPADVLEVAPPSSGPRDPRPRQVFIHAWCSRDARPYLMRFARAPQGDAYVAVRAHPLDAVEDDGDGGVPPVRSSQLVGCPPCPYCDNTAAGLCGCGAILCAPGAAEVTTVTCPRCRQTLSFGPPGGGGQGGDAGPRDFKIPGTAG